MSKLEALCANILVCPVHLLRFCSLQSTIEKAYAKQLGIFNPATQSYASDSSLASSAARRSSVVTFIATVPSNMLQSVQTSLDAITTSSFQAAIGAQIAASGVSISVPVVASVADYTASTRYGVSCLSYTRPEDTSWPSDSVWQADLGAKLSGGQGDLYKVESPTGMTLDEFYKQNCQYDNAQLARQSTLQKIPYPYRSVPDYPLFTSPWDSPAADFTGIPPARQPTNFPFKTGFGALPGVCVHTGLKAYGPWLLNPVPSHKTNDTYGISFIETTYPWQRQYGAHGICNQNPNGQYVGMIASGGLNLPAYTVTARSIGDVQAALSFATTHNIQVVVKNTGHSYHSGSIGSGTLMIWTANLPKFSNSSSTWKNSCGRTITGMADGFGYNGETPLKALKIGSGMPFREIYSAAFDAGTFLVGGTNPGVGGGGGWLFGGGISFASRHLGLGIDNVVEFQMVLPNGTYITADECSNTDMFWAMRGGGGGSFGVVTSATYKTWEDKPITDVYVGQMGNICGYLDATNITAGPAGSPTINTLLAMASDTNFTACGTLPNDEQGWNLAIGTASTNTCVRFKFARLCGLWGEQVLAFYGGALDERWGNNAQSTWSARGTIQELSTGDGSLPAILNRFWDFPGASSIVSAYGETLKYTMREFTSYYDYRLRWGQNAPFGPMANETYQQSGACAGMSGPGECVQKLIKDSTGQESTMIGHTYGYLWANYVGANTPGYNDRTSAGCSYVFDLTDSETLSLLKSGFPFGVFTGATNYMLGGKISNVPDDATALGPAQRDGQIYMPFPYASCASADQLIASIKSKTGAGYNHHGQYRRTDFDSWAWGSNAPRLQSIKQSVDPQHILNAQDTFGAINVCS